MIKRSATEHNRHTWPLWGSALALMLSASMAQQSEAATITVDQGGTCTLPDAIQAANTDTAVGGCSKGAGPDIIELETDVILTADLPSVELTDPANPSKSTLTINGNNHTIDGDNQFRILSNSKSDLTVNDCTITKGRANIGSGLSNAAGNTTLNNCTISNNSSPNADGGGVANGTAAPYHARLTLNNCIISGNTSHGRGGGIFNIANGGELTLAINNSIISGNTADTGPDTPAIGGGIYSYSKGDALTVITISGSTISGNSAEVDGGGIMVIASTDTSVLTITDSTINGNTSVYTGGGISLFSHGGAITTTVEGSTISGNTASNGAGVALRTDSPSSSMTIRNSTISGNEATQLGGGILIADYGSGGSQTLSNCTISGNSSDTKGGGIYIFNMYHTDTAIQRCLISGNEAPIGAEIAATLQLGGYNLLGHSLIDAAGGWQNVTLSTTDVSVASDSSSPFTLNAIIGSLKDNGGPTLTHALSYGSPAVDLAPGSDCATPPFRVDQRGFPRPKRGGCDAGAYELKSTLLQMIVPILSRRAEQ